jgi:hypothetical protein
MANLFRTLIEKIAGRRAAGTRPVLRRALPCVEELEARRLLSTSSPATSLVSAPVDHGSGQTPAIRLVISVKEYHSTDGGGWSEHYHHKHRKTPGGRSLHLGTSVRHHHKHESGDGSSVTSKEGKS